MAKNTEFSLTLRWFRPSPLLKDAELSADQSMELYREIVLIMRRLYNKCKLVHADLSEYNMM